MGREGENQKGKEKTPYQTISHVNTTMEPVKEKLHDITPSIYLCVIFWP